MKFLIISHVLHKCHDNQIWGYGPYVREMNLWEKYIDELVVVGPKVIEIPSAIDLPYQSQQIDFVEVPQFSFVGIKNCIRSVIIIPSILIKIFTAMRQADHIHLRCPGNMGLLGAFLQVMFPSKTKTAKYAGNWDWNSKQPLSYRLQQIILRNTFLTKGMTVLVYGDWPDKTVNIKPFFTASYSEKEIIEIHKPDVHNTINLIFAGTLSKGKRPLLSLEVLELLIKNGYKSQLVICGDGKESKNLSDYAFQHELTDHVVFLGNVDAERVKIEMQNAHFLIFGSESEGWPKVVAEAMWWGCIPVTTSVSCVPQMLGYGKRGILSIPKSTVMSKHIISLLSDKTEYERMKEDARNWSCQFTLEKFELEIKNLLVH